MYLSLEDRAGLIGIDSGDAGACSSNTLFSQNCSGRRDRFTSRRRSSSWSSTSRCRRPGLGLIKQRLCSAKILTSKRQLCYRPLVSSSLPLAVVLHFMERLLVPNALEVVCNVSPEELQPHRTKALLALRKLHDCCALDRLECGSLSPPLTHDHGSSSSSETWDTSPDTSPSTHPDMDLSPLPSASSSTEGYEVSPSPAISKLIHALNDKSADIKQYLSISEREATGDKSEWMIEDPRVVDLRIDETSPSPKTKFRRGLSQRSLATGFTRWEGVTYGMSRVDQLVADLSRAEARKGHISKYLEVTTDRFKNRRAARTGIEHGIKLLVFEKFFDERAVSAVLSFVYVNFRAIKYSQLPSLKATMENTEWIAELVEQKASWIDECQNLYEGR